MKKLQVIVAIAMCCLTFVSPTSAKQHLDHPYCYSVLDIPVSLALGTVRTPEFTASKTQFYYIMVQAEKIYDKGDTECMMSVANRSLGRDSCQARLLLAEWNISNGSKLITSGHSTDEGDEMYTAKYIFKFLGQFPAKKGEKYILDVRFTRDGTPLNSNHPHLIVVAIGEE